MTVQAHKGLGKCDALQNSANNQPHQGHLLSQGGVNWWKHALIQTALVFQDVYAYKTTYQMGIKIWSLCGSDTRYTLHSDVYTGKDVNPHSAEL
jgi:hypothetical protein